VTAVIILEDDLGYKHLYDQMMTEVTLISRPWDRKNEESSRQSYTLNLGEWLIVKWEKKEAQTVGLGGGRTENTAESVKSLQEKEETENLDQLFENFLKVKSHYHSVSSNKLYLELSLNQKLIYMTCIKKNVMKEETNLCQKLYLVRLIKTKFQHV
jgi:hypothetical protein